MVKNGPELVFRADHEELLRCGSDVAERQAEVSEDPCTIGVFGFGAAPAGSVGRIQIDARRGEQTTEVGDDGMFGRIEARQIDRRTIGR